MKVPAPTFVRLPLPVMLPPKLLVPALPVVSVKLPMLTLPLPARLPMAELLPSARLPPVSTVTKEPVPRLPPVSSVSAPPFGTFTTVASTAAATEPAPVAVSVPVVSVPLPATLAGLPTVPFKVRLLTVSAAPRLSVPPLATVRFAPSASTLAAPVESVPPLLMDTVLVSAARFSVAVPVTTSAALPPSSAFTTAPVCSVWPPVLVRRLVPPLSVPALVKLATVSSPARARPLPAVAVITTPVLLARCGPLPESVSTPPFSVSAVLPLTVPLSVLLPVTSSVAVDRLAATTAPLPRVLPPVVVSVWPLPSRLPPALSVATVVSAAKVRLPPVAMLRLAAVPRLPAALSESAPPFGTFTVVASSAAATVPVPWAVSVPRLSAPVPATVAALPAVPASVRLPMVSLALLTVRLRLALMSTAVASPRRSVAPLSSVSEPPVSSSSAGAMVPAPVKLSSPLPLCSTRPAPVTLLPKLMALLRLKANVAPVPTTTPAFDTSVPLLPLPTVSVMASFTVVVPLTVTLVSISPVPSTTSAPMVVRLLGSVPVRK